MRSAAQHRTTFSLIDCSRNVLGTAQTSARASSYYLPAVLATATAMALELGISRQTVFGIFSAALLVSAVVGPLAGRFIDQHGGRPVPLTSNAVFALGLAGLGLAQGPFTLVLAWMGCRLYDAALASLVRPRLAQRHYRYHADGRVGWPLSSLLEAHFGWRATC